MAQLGRYNKIWKLLKNSKTTRFNRFRFVKILNLLFNEKIPRYFVSVTAATRETLVLGEYGCPSFVPLPETGVIELFETNKKAHIYIWPIVKIEGATGSWHILI